MLCATCNTPVESLEVHTPPNAPATVEIACHGAELVERFDDPEEAARFSRDKRWISLPASA